MVDARAFPVNSSLAKELLAEEGIDLLAGESTEDEAQEDCKARSVSAEKLKRKKKRRSLKELKECNRCKRDSDGCYSDIGGGFICTTCAFPKEEETKNAPVEYNMKSSDTSDETTSIFPVDVLRDLQVSNLRSKYDSDDSDNSITNLQHELALAKKEKAFFQDQYENQKTYFEGQEKRQRAYIQVLKEENYRLKSVLK